MADSTQPQAPQAKPTIMPATGRPLSDLRIPIPIHRIDFRVQSINKDGWAVILAYKDARVDMDRLDEVVGVGFWQRKHERVGDDLHCHVSIWNPDLQEWACVSDVGTPSKTEETKGEASDSFKRACFNLGIGRELYEFPLILVQLKNGEFYMDERGGKPTAKASYSLRLRDWTWHCQQERDDLGRYVVKTLTAIDDNGEERFRFPRRGGAQASQDGAGSTQQQRAPGGRRGAGSGQGAEEKAWYNDFDRQRSWHIEQLDRGMSADDIIADLKTRFKLSRKTESEIRDLATDHAADNDGQNERGANRANMRDTRRGGSGNLDPEDQDDILF